MRVESATGAGVCTSEGWTTDHAVAVAALESSHGVGPGANRISSADNSYLRPASRT